MEINGCLGRGSSLRVVVLRSVRMREYPVPRPILEGILLKCASGVLWIGSRTIGSNNMVASNDGWRQFRESSGALVRDRLFQLIRLS